MRRGRHLNEVIDLKILVTGAAGFIGMHVAQLLLARGDSVVGLDNLNDYYDPRLKRDRLARLAAQPGFGFVELDVADRAAMQALFADAGFDRVVHLAAQAGVRYSLVNPQAYVDSNVVGFMNVLEGCRHASVQHLAYASSSSVYGGNTQMPFSEHHNIDHPVSMYAATKKANELMAHTYSHLFGLPTTGLRFFTVYGPWGRPDMALFLFTKAIIEGRAIDVFNHGKMQRDFTYIDDIVEGVVRVWPRDVVEGADHAFDDVVDVGEVADVMAVIEHVDRLAGEDLPREQEQRHVGPAPGAVHGEEAQPGGRQVEQMAVGVRHQLVGLLGGRIHADGVVDAVLDRERQLAVGTVDRARRGIDQVLDAVVAAGLEDVHEADDVAFNVGVRVLQRVAHAGLGGEIDHALRPEVGEREVHRVTVLERGALETEVRMWRQSRQARFLQARIVVVVEVVVAQHLVATRKQALAEFRTDEAGGAGDEDAHVKGHCGLGYAGKGSRWRVAGAIRFSVTCYRYLPTGSRRRLRAATHA